MANKSQKGSGGKRGHSNQDNWMTHQEEKELGRRLRRLEGKQEEQAAKEQASSDFDHDEKN